MEDQNQQNNKEFVSFSDSDFDIAFREDPLTAMEALTEFYQEKKNALEAKLQTAKEEKEKKEAEEEEAKYLKYMERHQNSVTPHVYNKYDVQGQSKTGPNPPSSEDS